MMMGLSLKRCFCVVVTVLLALQLLVIVLRVPLHLITSRQGFVLLHRHFWFTEPSVPLFDLEVSSDVSGKGSRHSRVLPEQIRFQLKANSSYDKPSLGSQTHFLRGYNKTKSVSTVSPPTFSELNPFNTAPTSSSFYYKNTKTVHSSVTGAPTVATGAKVVIPQRQLTRGPSQHGFLKPPLLRTSVEKRPMTLLVTQRSPSRRQIRQPRAANARPVLPPLPRPEFGSTPSAIRQDLERCSLNMGVSVKTLDNDTLANISNKASVFLSAVRSIVPSRFSTYYRSPCWNADVMITRSVQDAILHFLKPEGNQELPKQYVTRMAHSMLYSVGLRPKTFFCLPRFFIAGFPKSGTTSLDRALRSHPQIAGPLGKELHWWTRIRYIGEPGYNSDYARLAVMNYLLNFHKASKQIAEHTKNITYDGSQSTLWDSNFFVHHQDYCAMPAVLSRVLPNAKFIVLMRNPVTRLYSHYLWSCTYIFGNGISKWPDGMKQNVSDYFHKAVVSSIGVFNQCLQNSSLFECTNIMRFTDFYGFGNSPTNHCGDVGFRLSIGLYYVHLSKWLQFYPKEQFLFLKMEDISADPYSLVTKITDFLGVAPVSKESANKLFAKRANAQTVVLKNSESFQMQIRTRKLLEEFYRPYNSMLAELIADERFLWR